MVSLFGTDIGKSSQSSSLLSRISDRVLESTSRLPSEQKELRSPQNVRYSTTIDSATALTTESEKTRKYRTPTWWNHGVRAPCIAIWRSRSSRPGTENLKTKQYPATWRRIHTDKLTCRSGTLWYISTEYRVLLYQYTFKDYQVRSYRYQQPVSRTKRVTSYGMYALLLRHPNPNLRSYSCVTLLVTLASP